MGSDRKPRLFSLISREPSSFKIETNVSKIFLVCQERRGLLSPAPKLRASNLKL